MSESTLAPKLRLMPLPERGEGAPIVHAPALEQAPVVAHLQVAERCWLITLRAPAIAQRAQPGQFVMITLAREGEAAPVLPRPMAIYAWDRETGTIQVLYRVVGEGTRSLTRWRPGERMTTVGPLGRGFSLLPETSSILLLGRGIGTCSLTALSEVAARRGAAVHAVVSARGPEALVGSDVYRRARALTILEVVDTDGSSSVQALRPGLESLVQAEAVRQIFVCGSHRLLALGAQLGARVGATVQVSLEAHMACGLGYCHGCSSGHPGLAEEAPLVCKDGPVFACVEAPE